MKYLASYALAQIGGNNEPSSDEISAIINAAGGDVDLETLNHFMSLMKADSFENLINKGSNMLSCAGVSTSAAPASATGAAPVAETEAPAAPTETAKKAPPPVSSDSDSDIMDIFG
ncbi:60S acidic ribosomal protein P2-like [Octopus sinensis]|uniref:Large ribosomal subunit protein P2 n=1 Tax=Octopus sinensis TaxID=2607531 RepID=A0A6P7U3W7_9MOLL|nr:60S acidic ribosomal protein P2-like [Octopus sinensis]